MCLAIPGKVLEIDTSVQPRWKGEFRRSKKRCLLEFVPEVKVGDYVIVHVGFAINTLDEEEALETLKMLDK